MNNNFINAMKGFSLFLILSSYFLLQGCMIKDEEIPGPDPVTYFSIYHADPENKELDINIDNVKANSQAFRYTRYTGYNIFSPGIVNYKFLPLNSETVLHDTTITLVEDKIYTMFLVSDKNRLQSIVSEDVWTVPASGNAMIRLVNLSPDAPAISLFDEANEGLILNQAFKSISTFKEIKAGTKTIIIKTTEDGTLLKELSSFSFLSREIYTIVVTGYKDGTEADKNELKIEVVKNHTIY